jgi:hypothetical protein
MKIFFRGTAKQWLYKAPSNTGLNSQQHLNRTQTQRTKQSTNNQLKTMSFDSQRSADERDMTVEIIRDPGFSGDWYNRYCQNAETHVFSNSRI